MNPSTEHSESEFLYHSLCETCGSSDGLAHYSDGHTHCFVCEAHSAPTNTPTSRPRTKSPMSKELITEGREFLALPKRGLTEESCRKWGYSIHGVTQIADYRDPKTNEIVAQKVRYPDKDFKFINGSFRLLYGAHLWRDQGKMIVITEGEIDAITVSQIQGHKWPVVSIPNGTTASKKAIAHNIDYLNQFESVVFMFDMDKVGREAAAECAALLPPGKSKIASLPLKDPNEMLVAGRAKEVIDAIWGAKAYRPDGIVAGVDLWDRWKNEKPVPSVSYPFEGLNKLYRGLRKGESVGICAGTGSGKSEVLRHIIHHLITKEGQKVANIALEESQTRSAQGIMSVAVGKRLHIDGWDLEDPVIRKAYEETVGSGRYFSYDHFGSTATDNLLSRMRYFVTALGCGYVMLDHLSIVTSGDGEGDERRNIDNLCTKIRELIEELKFGLIYVVHLKKIEGVPHEEGAPVKLTHLRGSHGIAQLGDGIFSVERNQQAPTETERNRILIRALKNRFAGDLGPCASLQYDKATGRLSEGSLVAEGFTDVSQPTDY